MKKKKFFKVSPPPNLTPEVPKSPQTPIPDKANRLVICWAIGGALLAGILIAIGFFWGHHENPSNETSPDVILAAEQTRHGFIVKSSQLSGQFVDKALAELQKKDIFQAIKDCNLAISIFPMNAKAYILLIKTYLMTGQERKMYDVLTLAGRSYPEFNNIVSVIDDSDLAQLPLDEPQDKIVLANFLENKKMAISFMFDDGEANVYKALPTFEKYGFRATIPVVAGFVADKSGDAYWGSWSEWKDAADRGFEIANHSMYHRDSKILHGGDFDIAFDQAQELIEKNTGHKVTSLVFPHDSYSDEAVKRALRLNEAIRTPEFLQAVYNRVLEIIYGGPRFSVETANRIVDIALQRRLWLIAQCHGVTETRTMRSFKSITPEFLETHLAYLHSKAQDVWVDTFSHVYEYMAQRAQTNISINKFTDNSIDFILHNSKPELKLTSPLTVVVKTGSGADVKSTDSADGHALKTWVCGESQTCIDVDAYNENIHLQWTSADQGLKS